MPILHFNTNLKDKDVPADFDLRLCKEVGKVLGKLIERITLNVHTGIRQIRGGSTDPAATLDIYSVKVFDEKRNPTYTSALLPFICEALKLPESRVLLVYHDLPANSTGQKI